MNTTLPRIYLVRHGQTKWSVSGQHTGATDIPLTEQGECNARQLGVRLEGLRFGVVITSPLQRARRTCELAGFIDHAQLDADLMEWNYGDYEGRRTMDIRTKRPGWNLFRDGCPNGESTKQVGDRADRVISRLQTAKVDALLFAHSHLLSVLAVRWIGLPPDYGSALVLSEASVSILGYNHDASEPVIRQWNA